MKFLFLKSKKESPIPLESLRPSLFNVNFFWVLTLLLSFLILVVTFFIDSKLFYGEYNEGYKNGNGKENFKDLINVPKLKNAIKERSDFINKSTSISRDPSI